MPKAPPQPRSSNFHGMRTTAHIAKGGTWLEPEELCYPNGGMTRRTYALFPDGVKRVVTCGIPDTAWTVPAKPVRIAGVMVRGYVGSNDEGEVVFVPFTNQ